MSWSIFLSWAISITSTSSLPKTESFVAIVASALLDVNCTIISFTVAAVETTLSFIDFKLFFQVFCVVLPIALDSLSPKISLTPSLFKSSNFEY